MPQPVYEIDLSRISNKKVLSFIHENKLYRLRDFADLQCFSKEKHHDKSFNHHQETFFLNQPLEKVWKAYKTISPEKLWCGSMLQFGLQYCRNENKLFYFDDEFKETLAGQIVFIRVKVLGGLAKIAVGHEITAVNNEENYLETAYLMKGKSIGAQRIHLQEANGHTKITHSTIYKSNSRFRDKYIYPFFHSRVIKQFHQNVGKAFK